MKKKNAPERTPFNSSDSKTYHYKKILSRGLNLPYKGFFYQFGIEHGGKSIYSIRGKIEGKFKKITDGVKGKNLDKVLKNTKIRKLAKRLKSGTLFIKLYNYYEKWNFFGDNMPLLQFQNINHFIKGENHGQKYSQFASLLIYQRGRASK